MTKMGSILPMFIGKIALIHFSMIVDIILTVAQVVVFLYDVVTYPIYQVVGRITSKQKEKSTTPRAYLVKESSEEIRWRRDKSNDNAVYKEIIIDNKVE